MRLRLDGANAATKRTVIGAPPRFAAPRPRAAPRSTASASPMSLFIYEGSKLWTVSVMGSDTIARVKTLIADKGGPPAETQILYFLSMPLENDRTLSSYNIAPKSRCDKTRCDKT